MEDRQPARPQIRPATVADLPALNDIYNHYVRETPVTFDIKPISLAQRSAWFRSFAVNGPHRLFVATVGDEPQGFAWSHEFRAKEAYASSVEVTIYLAPDRTGQGVGTLLYGALFDALRAEGLHRAFAGITLPNPASVALHRKCGFREVGTFDSAGRKFGRWWSVQWFALHLDEAARRADSAR